MGWYIRKIEKGIEFNSTKPENKSYVELSFDTPDNVLYGLCGTSFEKLMEVAKRAEKGSLIESYKDYNNKED